MLSNIRKRNEGFTIIEVLIVLAIAGLIMLIVFLAVPALQRNSRNTQRKNDVARIGGAVQEFINNNGGTLPTTSAADATTLAAQFGKLAYYANANVTVSATIGGAVTNAVAIDSVSIVTGDTCNGANAAGGTARQIAILYATETGGANAYLCTSL